MIETFDFDNPITGALSAYDEAKQIYTEGLEERVGEREIGREQTEKESRTGGMEGSRGFPCRHLSCVEHKSCYLCHAYCTAAATASEIISTHTHTHTHSHTDGHDTLNVFHPS